MKLPKGSEDRLVSLKKEGWDLKSITQVYEDGEVKEIKVVFNSDRNGIYVTINTKERTILPSAPIPFSDISKFAEMALEGGFDIEN